MKIDLSDDFIERIRKYLNRQGMFERPIEHFLEEVVDLCIENDPWSYGDICVHNDDCMYHKSVSEWRE